MREGEGCGSRVRNLFEKAFSKAAVVISNESVIRSPFNQDMSLNL